MDTPDFEEIVKTTQTLRKQMNDRLNARAAVIKAVLEPFDFSQAALPFTTGTEGQLGARPLTVQMTETLKAAGTVTAPTLITTNRFGATGLRAAILDLLRTHGPMKAPSIAKILEKTGFKNDSKTPMATRVYNDLWRMIEPGIVENNDGVFKLKKTA